MVRSSQHLSPNVLLVTRQRWMGHISFAPGICPVCLTFSFALPVIQMVAAPGCSGAEIYRRFQFCISCELSAPFPVRECFRNNGRRIWVALFKSRCRKCISNCRLEDGCQECKVISNEWENTRTWTE